MVVAIVFDAIYWGVLMVFLIIAAGGWGLMKTDITNKKVVLAVVAAVGFSASSFVVRYAADKLHGWIVVVILIGLGSIALAVWQSFVNFHHARQNATGHLFSIFQRGIDHMTTPIYAKYRSLSVFFWFVIFSFTAVYLVAVILSNVEAPNWVDTSIYFFWQAILLGFLACFYRPRGHALDRYFRPDDEETGDRDRIQMDDLSGFDIQRHEGLRAWDCDILLPLEPVMTRSDRTRRLRGDGHQFDSLYTEALMRGNRDA
jgi:hypothetical protein